MGLGFHHTVKAVFVDFTKPYSFPSIGVLTLFESGVRRVGSLYVCFVHGSVEIKEEEGAVHFRNVRVSVVSNCSALITW